MALYRKKQPGDMSTWWLLLPVVLFVWAWMATTDGFDLEHFMSATVPATAIIVVAVGFALKLLFWIGALLWRFAGSR